jgi:hypothetical protein
MTLGVRKADATTKIEADKAKDLADARLGSQVNGHFRVILY